MSGCLQHRTEATVLIGGRDFKDGVQMRGGTVREQFSVAKFDSIP